MAILGWPKKMIAVSEQSAIAPTAYGYWPEDCGGKIKYRIAKIDAMGDEIPHTVVATCFRKVDAQFVSKSLTYALASASLAKPFVFDLLSD